MRLTKIQVTTVYGGDNNLYQKNCYLVFSKSVTEVYPSRTTYSPKKLSLTRKDIKTTYFVIPDYKLDDKAKDCIAKLRELNFDFTYGLARDSLEYLKNNGMFEVQ